MKEIKVSIPMTANEWKFLKKLAEYDGITPEEELVNLAKLQLREEIELKEQEDEQ